jgi:hypothetical protein
MHIRIGILSFALLFLVISVSPAKSGDAEDLSKNLSQEDAYFLIDNLVGLSELKDNRKQQLANYRKWKELQDKFAKKDGLSKEQMKIFLLMIFIAEEKAKVHPAEELARQSGPLFLKQSDMILDILKDTPFLIQSACNSLSDHFSLYKDKNAKEHFLKEYKKKIVESLGSQRGTTCLNTFVN